MVLINCRSRHFGDPGGIRTLGLHLERVASWAWLDDRVKFDFSRSDLDAKKVGP